MDYDLALDTSNDIIYDQNELLAVTNASLVAQDIKRTLLTPLGSLPWNTTVGSKILNALNAPSDTALIESEMLRIAQADERIDQEGIKIEYNENNSPVLFFVELNTNTTQEVSINV